MGRRLDCGQGLRSGSRVRLSTAGWLWSGFALLALTCTVEPETGNSRPFAPVLSGPEMVLLGAEVGFDVTVYDPDGGELRVYLAWGDGDTSDYGEFVRSGQTVTFRHRYQSADTFYVRGRCHDLVPLFSDWSSPKRVIVAEP